MTAWETACVGKKNKILCWISELQPPLSTCLPPDILEVLTDIDEMSRRRPEILSFFAVSISVSHCCCKEEVLFTRVCVA